MHDRYPKTNKKPFLHRASSLLCAAALAFSMAPVPALAVEQQSAEAPVVRQATARESAFHIDVPLDIDFAGNTPIIIQEAASLKSLSCDVPFQNRGTSDVCISAVEVAQDADQRLGNIWEAGDVNFTLRNGANTADLFVATLDSGIADSDSRLAMLVEGVDVSDTLIAQGESIALSLRCVTEAAVRSEQELRTAADNNTPVGLMKVKWTFEVVTSFTANYHTQAGGTFAADGATDKTITHRIFPGMNEFEPPIPGVTDMNPGDSTHVFAGWSDDGGVTVAVPAAAGEYTAVWADAANGYGGAAFTDKEALPQVPQLSWAQGGDNAVLLWNDDGSCELPLHAQNKDSQWTQPFRGTMTQVRFLGAVQAVDGIGDIGVFQDASALNDISALGSWNTMGVTTLENVFKNCSSLETLEPLAEWDVSKVSTLNSVFYYCRKVSSLSPLAKWDVSSVKSMKFAFFGMHSLGTLDGLQSWDVKNVLDYSCCFDSLGGETHGLNSDISAIGSWEMLADANVDSMFGECTLGVIPVYQNLNPNMYDGCRNAVKTGTYQLATENNTSRALAEVIDMWKNSPGSDIYGNWIAISGESYPPFGR